MKFTEYFDLKGNKLDGKPENGEYLERFRREEFKGKVYSWHYCSYKPVFGMTPEIEVIFEVSGGQLLCYRKDKPLRVKLNSVSFEVDES